MTQLARIKPEKRMRKTIMMLQSVGSLISVRSLRIMARETRDIKTKMPMVMLWR